MNGDRQAGSPSNHWVPAKTSVWPLHKDEETVGKVTSAVHSPRLNDNIALAMTAVEHAALGTDLQVQSPAGTLAATIVEKPFFDPKKTLATGAPGT